MKLKSFAVFVAIGFSIAFVSTVVYLISSERDRRKKVRCKSVYCLFWTGCVMSCGIYRAFTVSHFVWLLPVRVFVVT